MSTEHFEEFAVPTDWKQMMSIRDGYVLLYRFRLEKQLDGIPKPHLEAQAILTLYQGLWHAWLRSPQSGAFEQTGLREESFLKLQHQVLDQLERHELL